MIMTMYSFFFCFLFFHSSLYMSYQSLEIRFSAFYGSPSKIFLFVISWNEHFIIIIFFLLLFLPARLIFSSPFFHFGAVWFFPHLSPLIVDGRQKTSRKGERKEKRGIWLVSEWVRLIVRWLTDMCIHEGSLSLSSLFAHSSSLLRIIASNTRYLFWLYYARLKKLAAILLGTWQIK